MFKPLSIVSGVALLAAGGITYTKVMPVLQAERTQVLNAKANLDKAKANESAAVGREAEQTKQLSDTKASLTKSEREKAETAAKKQTVEKEVEDRNVAKEAAEKEMTDLQQRLDDLGGLPVLVQELKAQEAKRTEYETQIANLKDAITNAGTRKEASDKVITTLKRIDIFQKTGTMEPTFTSRVSSVNADWGFVTIVGGNDRRVVRQAKFDAVRGGSVVGKLIVTSVSPSQAVAEIIPGSVAAGDSILPGDKVVVSDASLPSNLKIDSSGAPAKAADAAPAADADPAVPAEAPADTSDPFAAPAATEEMPATDTPVEN